jgi:WD40 repeat protein/tRNA A-37 threonylcarbamoyl transferase component Bud32
MPSTVPCPDADRLQHFLLGDVPPEEGEQLVGHVQTCQACVGTLQTLQRADALVTALRRGGPVPGEAADPRVEALIDRVCRLRAWGKAGDASTREFQPDTAMSPGSPHDADTEDPTLPPEIAAAPPDVQAFLAPPEGPGEIGRLGGYRVLGVLGQGGMGTVLRAEDPGLCRPVALKVMRPGLAVHESARERFLREARAAAALRHEHVVTVYQVGEDRGVIFLAMEFLPGQSLEQRLRGGATLPLPELLRVGREVALGLAAAHDEGLIHRDIKPANIWIEGKEEGGRMKDESKTDTRSTSSSILHPSSFKKVKILDFGLARAVRQESGLTQVGVVVGTPGFMSPEQAAGQPVDGRCDLFSLGCVLYQAATGRPPFRGTDMISTLMAVALQDPPPPRQLNPALPQAVSDFILKLLAKNPADRPASAHAVAQTLSDLAAPPAPRRTGRRLLVAALVLVALAPAGAWYGPVVYRFLTNRGQLVVRTEDPGVAVRVKKDGETVEIIDVKAAHKVTLRAGEYDVELIDAAGGMRLSAEHLTLRRGGRAVIDVYREAAPCELIAECKGHTGSIQSLAFSADGSRLASGGRDLEVCLWDPQTGRQLGRLDGAPWDVLALAIAPNGDVLFGGGGRDHPSDGSVLSWARGADKPTRRFQGHTSYVAGLAVVPGSDLVLSAGWDKVVCVWKLDSGAEVGRFTGHTSGVNAVAVSGDGVLAASGGSDKTVRLWQVATRRPLHTLEGHTAPVKGVAVSADGRRVLSGSWDHTVRLWDAESGKELFCLQGHEGAVHGVALSPDGQRGASAGEDKSVRVWDLESGKGLCRLDGHAGAVHAVSFSPDGRLLASAGADRTVRVWKFH